MSEEKKPEESINKPSPEELAAQTSVTIQITWNMATGETTFAGPIGNKTLCYGMLKMAEKLVDGHVTEAQKKAQAGIMQKFLGINNGKSILRPPR